MLTANYVQHHSSIVGPRRLYSLLLCLLSLFPAYASPNDSPSPVLFGSVALHEASVSSGCISSGLYQCIQQFQFESNGTNLVLTPATLPETQCRTALGKLRMFEAFGHFLNGDMELANPEMPFWLKRAVAPGSASHDIVRSQTAVWELALSIGNPCQCTGRYKIAEGSNLLGVTPNGTCAKPLTVPVSSKDVKVVCFIIAAFGFLFVQYALINWTPKRQFRHQIRSGTAQDTTWPLTSTKRFVRNGLEVVGQEYQIRADCRRD